MIRPFASVYTQTTELSDELSFYVVRQDGSIVFILRRVICQTDHSS